MTQNRIKDRIEAADKIVVAGHIRADGDAVGSVLALGQSLLAAGKQVVMVLPDGVPSDYRFLTGSGMVKPTLPEDADLIMALDCSDMGRLGDLFAGKVVGINIDHHITNTNFGEINHVISAYPATAMIIAELLFDWGYPMPQEVLDALMAGLIADTLGFRTGNMTPDTLRMAARLMEAGSPLTDIYQRVLLSRSYTATAYWGQGLKKIQRQAGLIWTTLTLEDRRAAGYYSNDDADLINVLTGIEDMDVAVMLVEQHKSMVKVSWRARKGLDISQLAVKFGGGGHPGAAGAEVAGKLDEVEPTIIKATAMALHEQLEGMHKDV